MRNEKSVKNTIKQSLTALIPGTALLYLLLVYAPVEMYVANVEGFTHDIYDLLRMMVPLFLLAVLLMAVVLVLIYVISGSFGNRIAAVLSGLLLATYIQGAFLSSKLPPLDGSRINWADYDAQRFPSILAFVGSGVLVYLLFRFLKQELFCRIVRTGSLFLLTMLLVSSVMISAPGEGLKDKKDLLVTDEHIMAASQDKQNFVILLLDQVGGDDVNTIISENAEYKDMFEDFTFFRNTVGAYPFTQYSVPFILTGDWYENDESFFTYRDRVYAESPLFEELRNRKYRIGVYDEDLPVSENASGGFENTVLFDAKEFNAPVEFIKTQLKLAALKYLPYDLKRFCIVSPDYLYANSQKMYNSQITNSYDWRNASFYNKITSNSIELSEDSCFRFIHISGAHDPFIYDSNMNIVEQSGYADCVKASLKCAEEYCQRLKETDCFNNTVIIIMSDHGYYSETRQVPILMVKGVDERHEFHITDTPVSYADLQHAYEFLLDGGTAESAFPGKDNKTGNRRYLHYIYACEDHMQEYIQYGYATEESTFLPTGREYVRTGEHISTNSFF